MKLLNSDKVTVMSKAVRICIECQNDMKLVECIPSYVGTNSHIYKCSCCNNTEKVTTVSRAWLFTCSKELHSPT